MADRTARVADGGATHEEIAVARRRKSRGLCQHVEARAIAYSCRISRFFLQEAEEYIYVVGFVRRRLDLHRLLRLKDLDTAVSHGNCMMP